MIELWTSGRSRQSPITVGTSPDGLLRVLRASSSDHHPNDSNGQQRMLPSQPGPRLGMSCGTPATWERSSRVADATRLRVTLEYHLMRAHTSPPFVRIGVELSYRNVNQGIWLKRRQPHADGRSSHSPRSRVALSNSRPALKLFGCAREKADPGIRPCNQTYPLSIIPRLSATNRRAECNWGTLHPGRSRGRL